MMPNGKHPSFVKSFGYAVEGIAEAFKGERNFKVMLALGTLAVVAGFVLRIDALSWVAVLLMTGLVLFAELINTALESVVDLASPDFHPLAKRAKDLAAGAVLVLSVFVGLAGLVIYVRAALVLLGAAA